MNKENTKLTLSIENMFLVTRVRLNSVSKSTKSRMKKLFAWRVFWVFVSSDKEYCLILAKNGFKQFPNTTRSISFIFFFSVKLLKRSSYFNDIKKFKKINNVLNRSIFKYSADHKVYYTFNSTVVFFIQCWVKLSLLKT